MNLIVCSRVRRVSSRYSFRNPNGRVMRYRARVRRISRVSQRNQRIAVCFRVRVNREIGEDSMFKKIQE